MSPPPRGSPARTTLPLLRARLRLVVRRLRLRAREPTTALLLILLIILLFSLFLLPLLRNAASSSASRGSTHNAPFLLGVARVNITPTEPVYLSGFATRTKAPSTAALLDPALPLFARALAVREAHPREAEDVASSTALVLVSLDVLAVPRALSARVRAALCRTHGLRRERVHIVATHTHSGAALTGALAPLTPADFATAAAVARHTAYVERCVSQAVKAALSNPRPAFAHFGAGDADLAVNRREVRERDYEPGGGRVGRVDHSVPVLHFTGGQRAGSDVSAVLFSYAAHATVLTSGMRYSPDLPGVAAAAVEAAHPGAVALFAPGCAGDQNVYPRGSETLLRRHGAALARSALGALGASKAATDFAGGGRGGGGGGTAAALREVALPFAARYGRAELRRRANDGTSAVNARAAALLQAGLGGAARTAALYNTSVGAWRIGNVVLALLPGEPTVGYASRVRAVGADMVLGYVDDVMGYVGTADVVRAGGREGGERAAWYYGLPAAWRPDVEDVIMSGVRGAVTAVRDSLGSNDVVRDAG